MKKKITIGVLVLFFIVIIGVTIWSRTSYQKSLPQVTLVLPVKDSFTFHYTKYGEASIYALADERFTHQVVVEITKGELTSEFLWSRDEAVTISFSAEKQGSGEMTATIVDVKENEVSYSVVVGFNRSDTIVGDSVVVEFLKSTNEVDQVVPIQTIYDLDSDFPYVLVVKEVKGPWGKEYVVNKENVAVIMQDYSKAYITGYRGQYPIILSTDSFLMEGMKVRFYP